jgi:hypothetical protein
MGTGDSSRDGHRKVLNQQWKIKGDRGNKTMVDKRKEAQKEMGKRRASDRKDKDKNS